MRKLGIIFEPKTGKELIAYECDCGYVVTLEKAGVDSGRTCEIECPDCGDWVEDNFATDDEDED